MASPSEQRMRRLVAQLEANPGIVGQLPSEEGVIVEAALAGQSVYAIANRHGVSTEAVWSTLGNAARLASGQEPARPIEVGGLGSDTDPGVSGGYSPGELNQEPAFSPTGELAEGEEPPEEQGDRPASA